MSEIVKETDNQNNDSKLPEINDKMLMIWLAVYYKRLFPHNQFCRWLSYNKALQFVNREFSFSLENDIVIRYQSFENEAEFKQELCKTVPLKIDIGAVMNVRPKDRAINKMVPIEKELVFDIDMTDYDEIRTCCSGADICSKCWKFMGIACNVIDTALREDFNFQHILWVFSGRRGIHGWVCDQEARILDGKGRTAISEYLTVLVSGGSGTTVAINDKMHHSVKRALGIVEPLFEEICLVDQNIFGSAKGVDRLLATIPEEEVRKDLANILSKFEGDSKQIWAEFVRFVSTVKTGSASRRLKFVKEEVILAHTYPRLDINVSKGFNHLLKAPFCVHPKTGKICVPFSPNLAQKFDPSDVPTISAVLTEVNEFDLKMIDVENPTDKSRIKVSNESLIAL